MSLLVGDVFWLVNPILSEIPQHPHIVVGITPDKRIFYVFTTTDRKIVERSCLRIENKSEPRLLKTMIVVEPRECNVFLETSYINTNLSFDKDEYSLTRLSTFSIWKEKRIDNTLFNRIKIGLLSSDATKNILRTMLLSENA
jgi:hypothetical protein